MIYFSIEVHCFSSLPLPFSPALVTPIIGSLELNATCDSIEASWELIDWCPYLAWFRVTLKPSESVTTTPDYNSTSTTFERLDAGTNYEVCVQPVDSSSDDLAVSICSNIRTKIPGIYVKLVGNRIGNGNILSNIHCLSLQTDRFENVYFSRTYTQRIDKQMERLKDICVFSFQLYHRVKLFPEFEFLELYVFF